MNLYFLTFRENDLNRLFGEKSEMFNRMFDDNLTKSKILITNCEYNIPNRDFESKKFMMGASVCCLTLMNNQPGCTIESTKNANVTTGIKLSKCPNSRSLKDLETQFGKLFRVGSVGGYNWTDDIPSRPCRLVHAPARSIYARNLYHN
jgi:hypothetical protein